ncbi:MAG: DUF4367 domain-containing protein [Firmicutes bacterium]|nr:DUF4367 domain-containing protein [Bacillota bacterium]
MNKDELLAQAVQEYQAARVAAMEKAARKPKPEPKVLSLPTPEVRERPKILPQSRRWAAAAAMLVLLLLVPTIQAAMLGWQRNTDEFYAGYSYSGQTEVQRQDYTFGWLPEGLTEYAPPQHTDIGGSVKYVDADGWYYRLSYTYASEDFETFLYTVGYEYSVTQVNGLAADLYIPTVPDESPSIVWFSEDGKTMFEISAPVDRATLIRLAEGVTPVS